MKLKYNGEPAKIRGIGFVETGKTYQVEKKAGAILLASGLFEKVGATAPKKKAGK